MQDVLQRSRVVLVFVVLYLGAEIRENAPRAAADNLSEFPCDQRGIQQIAFEQSNMVIQLLRLVSALRQIVME